MPDSLSHTWRVNKSSIQAIEMASALKALGRVIGTISNKKEEVRFIPYGIGFNVDSKKIYIGAEKAKGPYPIPDNNFDVMVGVAIHEAGHSEQPRYVDYTGRELPEIPFKDFDALVEDIYIDNWIRRNYPRHTAYLDGARKTYEPNISQIDSSNYLQVWLYKWIHEQPFPSPPSDPVHILFDGLAKILKGGRSVSNPSQRSLVIIKVYDNIVSLLDTMSVKNQLKGKSKVANLPQSMQGEFKDEEVADSSKQASDSFKQESLKQPMHIAASATNAIESQTHYRAPQPYRRRRVIPPTPAKKPSLPDTPNLISPELAGQIEAALDSDTQDITQIIQSIAPEPGSNPIIFKKAMSPIANDPDKQLVQSLQWIKQYKNTTGQVTNKGLPEGRLNRKQLHRHAIDGLTYKQTRTIHRQKLDIVLLLDASISMEQGQIIYQNAQALHKVLPKIQVLSYSTGHGITIEWHTYDGKFHEITPLAQTPSGTALLATAERFPNSLIIHFTDGGSNIGHSPKEALQLIEKRHPKTRIVNVVLNNLYMDYISEYPESRSSKIIQIDSYDQFSGKLQKLLERW